MSRQRLSQVHVLLIVSLTPLVFYARLAWTQEGPSASKTPTQVSILAAPFAEAPEGGVGFRPAYKICPRHLRQTWNRPLHRRNSTYLTLLAPFRSPGTTRCLIFGSSQR